nr:polysaccharide pyruvyl transferase family protein [Cryobacterium algoricola]
MNALRKFGSPQIYDLLGRSVLRGEWATPYVPSYKHARRSILVTSAIGASSLDSLRASPKREVVRALSSASYVSVRDEMGRSALSRQGIESELVPDSVAILTELRSIDLPPVDSELVFQVSQSWLKSRHGPTLDAIERLSKDFATIRLLPIGLAGGHGDQFALAGLHKDLKGRGIRNVVLCRTSTVWDVADAISTADVFVGTSLHGAVTAMAYGVPHVGLDSISKLDAYLTTWGGGLTPVGVDIASLDSAVAIARRVSRSQLESRSRYLGALAWKNSVRVLETAAGHS